MLQGVHHLIGFVRSDRIVARCDRPDLRIFCVAQIYLDGLPGDVRRVCSPCAFETFDSVGAHANADRAKIKLTAIAPVIREVLFFIFRRRLRNKRQAAGSARLKNCQAGVLSENTEYYQNSNRRSWPTGSRLGTRSGYLGNKIKWYSGYATYTRSEQN